MQYSVELPLARIKPEGDFQSEEGVRAVIAAIAESCIDACHLSDHPAPSAAWLHNDPTGHDTLDPLSTLAFVAAAAPKLQLITNVLILPYRNPFLIAKAAASLQMLSGGRLQLGVGTGYQKVEFDALGVDFAKRGKLMDEAIEAIRKAWAGGAVDMQGIGFNAAGIEPRPVPRPHPPILIGGGSLAARDRAARLGDGWAPFLSVPTNDPAVAASAITSIEQLRERIDALQEKRAALGRTGPFTLALNAFWPKEGMTSAGADMLREQVGRLAEVGVNWTRFTVPAQSRTGFLENLAWLSKVVLGR